MNRETKKITTPIGNQVIEIKTYITGREKRDITNIYLSGNLDFNADTQSIKGINAGLADKAQDLALQTIVVSIDGNAEGIVEQILNMRSEDTDFIFKAIDEVQRGEKKTI